MRLLIRRHCSRTAPLHFGPALSCYSRLGAKNPGLVDPWPITPLGQLSILVSPDAMQPICQISPRRSRLLHISRTVGTTPTIRSLAIPKCARSRLPFRVRQIPFGSTRMRSSRAFAREEENAYYTLPAPAAVIHSSGVLECMRTI